MEQSPLIIWLERIMTGFGAGWVMYLMLGLSVISVAVILERAWFFNSLKDDLGVLAKDLREALEDGVDAAKKRMQSSPSAEAAVVMAGLSTYTKGPRAAEEAMDGAKALQRMKLEKRLVYLATLGNNAPFIGLFGTVIGVIGAFKALGSQAAVPAAEAAAQALAPTAVMSSISEALVATAVGIFIAIPAVAANNYFMRATKRVLANTEALTKVLLSHMNADPAWAPAPASARPTTSGNKKSSKRQGD
ncbi:MAG: MotA/TolQ/ExbB proton channel family protein [Myxococcota bacterium]